MKYIYYILIIVITFVFLLCTFLINFNLYDTYFKIDDDATINYIYLKAIQFLTALVLISTLIAHAKYLITLNKNIKKAKLEIAFGITFSALLIIESLSYYYTAYVQNNLYESFIMNNAKAKNDLIFANAIFQKFGVSIEYYDFQNNVIKFTPSKTDYELKNIKDLSELKMNLVPIFIVIIFSMSIISYYLGLKLANRKIKKEISK